MVNVVSRVYTPKVGSRNSVLNKCNWVVSSWHRYYNTFYLICKRELLLSSSLNWLIPGII